MSDSLDGPIILDCDQCGTHTVFGPVGLKGDDRIACPTCHVDYGSVAELLAVKQAFAEEVQAGFGKAFEGIEGIKFTKDDL